MRGSSPLLPVAFHATGDDVLPLRPAAPGFGDNVVVREVLTGVLAPAVLALVAVPRIDILPREPDRALRPPDHLQQPDYRGKLERKTH